MNIIDTRTVMLSYIVSNAICAAVMMSLWFQNRGRIAGLNFWLADFVMQFFGMLFIALRGVLPDFISILFGNLLIIGGTVLLYIGLERFTGRQSSQIHNYVLLVIFISVHVYFTYVQPSLQARSINVSLAGLAICSQCAWLLLKRVQPEIRRDTKTVGIVLAVISLVGLVRAFVNIAAPLGRNFFQPGLYDTLVLLASQMLFIGLTFGLFLMVNRRLLSELESDMVKRAETEEALKKSEEKFSKAFHNSPDGIVISSISDGRIIEVNDGFFRLSGFTQEEIVGKTSIEINLWDEIAHRGQYMEALQKNGRVLNYEVRFRKKTGELFDGLISGEVMSLQNLPCALTTIHDISERKKAENELVRIRENLEEVVAERTTELRERMAEVELLNRALANLLNDFQAVNRGLKKTTSRLESANKELEAFSYSVSHDLRSPLRGIDGWSLALLEDYDNQLDERAKTYLHRVRSETQRMGQLIDALLQLSHLTNTEITRERVDLSALASTIADHLQKSQPDRQVEFIIQPGLIANGDTRLLEIALTNLLGNAFKFTSKTPQAQIQFGRTEADGRPAFFVRDNGAGFDLSMAKKLFRAFQRMHKASDFPGTGVGLTTVQRIVHLHGGRIWAEAAINQGATFYFTLKENP